MKIMKVKKTCHTKSLTQSNAQCHTEQHTEQHTAPLIQSYTVPHTEPHSATRTVPRKQAQVYGIRYTVHKFVKTKVEIIKVRTKNMKIR